MMEVPITDFEQIIEQIIDLKSKSVDWYLYDRELRHERVKTTFGLIAKYLITNDHVQDIYQG